MSQNSIVLPTTGTFSGLTEQGYINNALDSLNTKFSGSSAPGSPETGQWWLDNNVSTAQVLNIYDGANWDSIGVMDISNSIWTPPVGGGAIPTIASATTTDLGSVPQARKYVSGTTTITSFGSSAVEGTIHSVKFLGSLQITQSSNILTLSGSNMAVSANDEILAVANGSGVWRVLYWSGAGSLPSISNNNILANVSGSTAAPTGHTLSTVLDIGGATNGTLPYRSGGSWSNTGVSAILDAIVGSSAGQYAVRGASVWGQGIPPGVQGSRLNLRGKWASNTTATFTASQLVLQTTSQGPILITSFNKTLNTGTTGAGGLDTGSLAASTLYNVFAIYNGTTQNILFSLSATSPTLPSGYIYFARIGTILTDGSSNIIGFEQDDNQYDYITGSNLAYYPIVISGSSGDPTINNGMSSANVSGYVPPTASKIKVRLWGDISNNTVCAGPNNNYGPYNSGTSAPPLAMSSSFATVFSIMGEFSWNSGSPYFYYASNSTNAYLSVVGFQDNL